MSAESRRRRGGRPSRVRTGDGGAPATDEGWVGGRHPVREALQRAASGEGPGVEKVSVSTDDGTSRWWERGPADLARAAGVVVARVPRAALDRLAPAITHQGVLARLRAVPTRELAEVLDAVGQEGEAPLLVLADGVEDPRNLGALVRAAAAAGAGAVILPERRSAGLTAVTAKAAAGALARIAVARAKSVQRALETLSDRGVWTVGLAPGAPSLWEGPDLTLATCFVVGGEGRGLSRLARERCDRLAGLPLAAGVESLNTAVAAGIALYEARRQRSAARSAGRDPVP